MTDLDKPSQTIEDYLALIYVIERDGEPIIGARLADLLGVTPPTVTNTLKRMVRDGLITMEENGTHLTKTGWEYAKQIMRRHMLTEWMMVRMLPWSKLHSEAHNLEHAISEIAENALDDELGHPSTCPHGNPLPGYEKLVESWLPLTQMNQGQKVIIRRIHELAENNAELMEFLEKKGVLLNKAAILIESLPINQTLTLELDNKMVTLGFSIAKYIFVEPIDD